MKRKLKLAVLVIFLGGFLSAHAQKVDAINAPKDKKKIELRPNSLDYGPVRRDNLGTRVDRVKDKNLFVNKRPAVKRKFDKPDTKREPNKDQRIKRRQRLIQRRTLNR